MDQELRIKAMSIPLKVLRAELKDIHSRKKIDYLNELEKRDSDKLKALAEFYILSREKSSFFFKPVEGKSLPETEKIIKSLVGKKRYDKDKDLIYEVSSVTPDPQKKELYVKIKCFSDVRTLRGNEPGIDDLKSFKKDYRKPFTIFSIIHPEDDIVEIRTKSCEKSLFAANILSKEIMGEQEKMQKVVIPKSKQEEVDKDIRCKGAVIRNLNFSGAEEIRIFGEDVESTLDAFKEHKLDFVKMGGEVTLIRNECDNHPVQFHDDGRVSFKKISEVYPLLKKTLK